MICFYDFSGASSYTVFITKIGEIVTAERHVKDIKTNLAKIDRLSSGSLYYFQVIAVSQEGLKSEKSSKVQHQTGNCISSKSSVFNNLQ